jgi:hypothetical protein
MAHKFDQSRKNPYVVAAQEVESHVFSGQGGYQAGADEDLYGTLGDAVVTALGDIVAQAFRSGLNEPGQVKGLAKAVAAAAEEIMLAYQGEVSPGPTLDDIAADSRISSLPQQDQDELRRELDKTRQLEELVLSARRLPALIDFAGSLGLRIHEDSLSEGPVLVSANTEQPSAEAQ